MIKLNPNELDAQAFLFIGPPQTIGNLNPTNTGTIKHLRSRRATVKAARHELPTPLIGFSWRARIDRSAQRLRLLNAQTRDRNAAPCGLDGNAISSGANTRLWLEVSQPRCLPSRSDFHSTPMPVNTGLC